MSKPKSNKVYKAICAGNGKAYTVRPDVWDKRVQKFNTDSETLQANYLSRDALKVIKGQPNPKTALHQLQISSGIQTFQIDLGIWAQYLKEEGIDNDVKEVIKVEDNSPVSSTGVIETIEV